MDKQTIINDLVARIPYGVVVNCTDGDVQIISVDFEGEYEGWAPYKEFNYQMAKHFRENNE